MKLHVQGQGPVTLLDSDFVAAGGEGKIYARGNDIFKVYSDPAKAIPAAKIAELAQLDRPTVVRPRALLLDQGARPVGFTMRRVSNAVPLARLFTNDFRRCQGITPERTFELVEAMRATIRFIHERGCLIVDGNEMNYLVDESGFTTPYFIDVDSYQTPSFPATAIMPTIRDWHARRFSPLSDWFSFAVVACQLFLGIHPYKGHHPAYKKHDLEGRMRANASIFNGAVSLPPAARDFSLIPCAWRDWFVALFEHGQREPPPQRPGGLNINAPPARLVRSNADLTITLLQELPDAIVRCHAYNGIRVIATRRDIFIGKRRQALLAPQETVLFTPKRLAPLLVRIEAGCLCLRRAETAEAIACSLKAERMMVVENTLYVLYRDDFMQVRIHELGDKIFLSPGATWKVLPKATSVLQSMLYQNVLGRSHLLIPFSIGACQFVAVPELDGYKIVDGRWDRGAAIVMAYREGHYERFVFRFNRAHTRYTLRIEQAVETPLINFVTLEQGIVVCLNGNGVIEVFSADPTQDTVKLIDNPGMIGADTTLAKDGTSVLVFDQGKLFKIAMRA